MLPKVRKCLDWVEECELLLNGPLASNGKAVKANYVLIWAGKTGRTHIKALNLTTEQKGDPGVLLKKFVEWTKSKSNALAAAANFRRLEHGDLSLAEYIDKATILCDQCEYPPEARDRLLRDAIVIGLRSKKAYYKCIEKGSELTLEEAIEIAQNQDATTHQVGYMRPEFKGDPLQIESHKLQGNRQSGAKWKIQQPHRQGSNDQSYRTGFKNEKRASCFHCGAKPSHPKSECPAKKDGHYGSVCRSKSKDARVNELQVQSATAPKCVDCILDEYEPVYFNAPIHHLKTVTVESLNHPKSEPHIRPLWLSQESSSQIFQIDCEVDTGASCNILPLYKAKALFGEDLKLGKPTVNLKGYNDSPVGNLGSCIVYLYRGNKMYRVLCEIANSKGHMILGRKQALVMEYVSFPEIQKPAVQAKADRSIKTLVEKPSKPTNGPVIPRIQKCTDPVVPVIQKRTQERITIIGKTHSLPTTKDYLLQEYADVFQGIGTLPGGPYRIKLKESYKPVQHPPRHVTVSLKPPYKAELERLTQLRVIKEVREHTNWINSIVPVKKPDGSLRLCLDPKDLNHAIKRNQWYSRIIDDILPELADSKYFSLLDAKSGYWHVPLDRESSLLTTFNTPWLGQVPLATPTLWTKGSRRCFSGKNRQSVEKCPQ